MTDIHQPPRTVDSIDDGCFYHTMELPGHGVVQGQWDLRETVDDYFGQVDVSGKTVLDVGCASGFLSFALEQRGGTVTSFDADDASRYRLLPFRDSTYIRDRKAWLEETNAWVDRLHNSYWFAHRALASRNRVVYGDIYHLPEAMGTYDVAVIGQMLIHLSDPIQALTQVALRCHGTLIITEDMLRTHRRYAKLKTTAKDGGPPYHFWVLSIGTYRELLTMLGFEIVSFKKYRHRCTTSDYTGMAPLHTLVARAVT